MSGHVEKETVGKKVSSFMENHRKGLIVTLVIVLVLLVAYIVFFAIGKSAKEKDLAVIDEITFTLVDDSYSADEAELESRRNKGLEDLQPLITKKGIVGARANMLCAELSYQLEKLEDAVNYWMATATLAKKTYIEPIAFYNLGVCYEDMGKLEDAASNYKLAAEDKEFILNTHAQFSYGRCLESQGKFDDAVKVYVGLNDQNPDDSWANLAKTRIIALEAEGKAVYVPETETAAEDKAE